MLVPVPEPPGGGRVGGGGGEMAGEDDLVPAGALIQYLDGMVGTQATLSRSRCWRMDIKSGTGGSGPLRLERASRK